ncbi:hypothetical protein [uncultured Desulfovibrio sp.]|uniref:hypothetical protein n=1 Tax=uncultured Desulfovibrio sp. TaxID=167968 RepID=UPI002620A8DE|nr:hypothetical protein [uncultured Desulfovibrio sp.]
MISPSLAPISPAELRTLKTAIRRAISELSRGDSQAERSRHFNAFYLPLYRHFGIARLQDLPAGGFTQVVAWLQEHSRPTPCAGLESRVSEARAALRAATAGLHEYRRALQALRRAGEELQSVLQDSLALSGNGPAWAADALHLATAGGFIDLEAELLRLKDRAEAHALALLRLARGLEQGGADGE